MPIIYTYLPSDKECILPAGLDSPCVMLRKNVLYNGRDLQEIDKLSGLTGRRSTFPASLRGSGVSMLSAAMRMAAASYDQIHKE